MILRNLACRRIALKEATDFYRRYEHLGNPGLGVYHWATFHGSAVVAVVSFGTAGFSAGRGVIGDIASRYGLRVYQLTRGGTLPSAPRGIPSWTVSQGLRGMRRLKGDCLIAAYSDPHFNEIGTIYQACNFAYLGMTNPKNQSTYVIHGRKQSAWVVRRTYGTRCLDTLRQADPDVEKIPLRPKYRYVFPAAHPSVKRLVFQALEPHSHPYPKREAEGVEAMDTPSLVRKRLTSMPIPQS